MPTCAGNEQHATGKLLPVPAGRSGSLMSPSNPKGPSIKLVARCYGLFSDPLSMERGEQHLYFASEVAVSARQVVLEGCLGPAEALQHCLDLWALSWRSRPRREHQQRIRNLYSIIKIALSAC